MRTKIIFGLALLLAGSLVGCSTTTRQTTKASSTDPDFSILRINGVPYQTKPIRLHSGGLFYWFMMPDLKRLNYEPCCGYYDVDLLTHNDSELIFKIVKSYGIPLDLRNGDQVASSDVLGKKYRAKLEGDYVVSVSEINHSEP